MPSITIIHATSDAAIGDKIANALLLEGHSVRRVARSVSHEITKADPAIVVWSQGAASEPFVLDFANAALQQDALIPVSIAGAPAPTGFERLPPIDLTGWAGDVGPVGEGGVGHRGPWLLHDPKPSDSGRRLDPDGAAHRGRS